MSASKTLTLAILSMDAYSRGYGRQLNVPGLNLGDGITFTQQSNPIQNADPTSAQYNPAFATGFYAAAYQWNGSTVIAYRGTDNQDTSFNPQVNPLSGGSDVWNGWVIGAGFNTASQAGLAQAFYTQVTGQSISSNSAPSNVLITGHSLGGGLAGYVATLTGAQASIFDNMPFGAAVIAEILRKTPLKTWDDVFSTLDLPTGNNITQTYVNGEVLQAIRPLGEIFAPLIQSIEGMDPITANLVRAKGAQIDTQFASSQVFSAGSEIPLLTSAVNLHSMALLAILQYAQDSSDTKWKSAALSLYNAYFNANIGAALGLVQTTNKVSGTGDGDVSTQLLDMIAYTGLGEGPFGSAAIQSLFADADTLGQLVSSTSSDSLVSVQSIQNAIAEIAVEHAGDQAIAYIQQSITSQDTNGVLQVSSDKSSLDINLTSSEWASSYYTSTGYTQSTNPGSQHIVGVNDLLSAIAADANATIFPTLTGSRISFQSYLAQYTPGEVDLGLTDSAVVQSLSSQAGSKTTTANAVLIGEAGSDTMIAGDGDNLIVGGQSVTAGNGNNTILGVAKNQQISVGSGSNIIYAGGVGDIVTINATQKATHLNASGPTFNFVYAAYTGDTFNFIDDSSHELGLIVQPITEDPSTDPNLIVNEMMNLDTSALEQSGQSNTYQYQDSYGIKYSLSSSIANLAAYITSNHGSNQSTPPQNFDITVLFVPETSSGKYNFEINSNVTTFSSLNIPAQISGVPTYGIASYGGEVPVGQYDSANNFHFGDTTPSVYSLTLGNFVDTASTTQNVNAPNLTSLEQAASNPATPSTTGTAIHVSSSATPTDASDAIVTIAPAVGSSSTPAEVDGDNNTIAANGSDFILISGTYNTVDVNESNNSISDTSNSDTSNTFNLLGSGNSVDINGKNEILFMSGSNSIARLSGSNSTLNMSGDDEVAFIAAGNSVNVTAGSGDVITATSSSVTFADGLSAEVDGSGNTITAGSNLSVTTTGTSDIVNVTGAASDGQSVQLKSTNATINVSGSNNTLNSTGTSNTINLQVSHNGAVETGSSNVVNVSAVYTWATLYGASSSLSDSAGESWITLYGNDESVTASEASDTINVSGTNSASGGAQSVQLQTYKATININGTNDTVSSGGTGNTINVQASSDGVVEFGNTNSIAITATYTWETMYGAGSSINDTAGSSWITLYGNNESVTASEASDTINVSGTSSTAGGTQSVQLQTYKATINIDGTNDTVSAGGTGNTINVQASSDGVVEFGSGNSVAVTANNTWETLYGAGSSLTDTSTGSSWITLYGTNETVTATGKADTINVSGTGASISSTGDNTTFVLNAGFTTAAISGFSQNGNDVISLSNAEFASFADVIAHASSSGSDTIIASHGDSLTLKNVSVSSLASSNFSFHS